MGGGVSAASLAVALACCAAQDSVGDLVVEIPGAPEVACGNDSTLGVSLRNRVSESSIRWSATVTVGPFEMDGPNSGEIAGDASTAIVVRVRPPANARPLVPLTGNLHISSNDPEHPEIDVPLSVTPRGALLRVPSFPVELGDIPLGKASPVIDVTVVNDGDIAADILPAASPNPRFTVLANPPVLAPGASGIVKVQFAPDQLGDAKVSLPLATRGPLCGAPALQLHGKGTNGKALVSPGALDFGLVDCGTTADAKTLTVENVGDAAFDVDAALAQGTSFAVSPTHATVPAQGKVLLTVTPSAVPAVSAITSDLYGDTLTLTTTAQGDVPHVIPLHETAHGAILSVSLPQTAIRARVDDVVTKPVAVTNTGNATAVGAMTSTNGMLAIPALTIGSGATVNATLEVRADPAKLGIDVTEPVSWNVGPQCGTGTISGLVHAYDTTLDLQIGRWAGCALGHSHRVYCWGDTLQGNVKEVPLDPGVYPTPVLMVGETGDQLGTSLRGLWLRSNTGNVRRISRVNGVTQVEQFTFPGSFTKIARVSASGNYGWCGLTSAGGVSCIGEAYRQWAHTGACAVASSPVSGFDGVGPVDEVVLGWSRGFAIRAGEVWTSQGCDLGGNAVPASKIAGLSNVVQISIDGRACAVLGSGSVVCWEASSNDGPSSFYPVLGLPNAVAVVVREGLGSALRSDGTIVSFDASGQIAYAGLISGLTNPSNVFPGYWAICGTRSDGAVLCNYPNSFLFTPIAGFEGP